MEACAALEVPGEQPATRKPSSTCTDSNCSRGPVELSKAVVGPVKQLRPPEVGSCVLGQVSAVVSPSCFYLVFPYGRRSIERLSMDGMDRYAKETFDTLTRGLQVSYTKACSRGNRRTVKALGEMVAAKSNLDGRWYRARVVSLEEGDRLKVFYVDSGFCESVPSDQVNTLETSFAQLPQQAVQACLVTDKAKNRLGNKPIWDEHSCETFASFVSGEDLVVKVVCAAQGLLHVRLFFPYGDQLCSVWRCLRKSRKTEPK